MPLIKGNGSEEQDNPGKSHLGIKVILQEAQRYNRRVKILFKKEEVLQISYIVFQVNRHMKALSYKINVKGYGKIT